MNWILSNPSPGDMIRIRVGAIWHYGVYCSDDEVIEFGDAPLEGLNRDAAKIFVKRVSVDEFSAGKLVEVGALDRAEKRKRFSPNKTMQIARSRIGEGGYDILKNNCEHFANECVFGKHTCRMEEEAREKWRERPALDVYLADLSQEIRDASASLPRPLLRRIKKMGEEGKKELFLWNLLAYAAEKSFAYEPSELRIRKNRQGDFVSEKLSFSLCRTDRTAIVAISHEPVGVSAKAIPAGEKTAFYRALKENALAEYRRASFGTDPESAFGICDGPEPICLALCGDTARATLIWRYGNAGARTLQKLLPVETVISL